MIFECARKTPKLIEEEILNLITYFWIKMATANGCLIVVFLMADADNQKSWRSPREQLHHWQMNRRKLVCCLLQCPNTFFQLCSECKLL
ncbi:non-specific serine/threonine protein kinase [Trifolium repens]|nr:non-specific serine/threonine protein kinase [Trifolium repens]